MEGEAMTDTADTPEGGFVPPEIETRFTYHAPKLGQAEKYLILRNMAKALAVKIDDMVPKGREQSLALTKIEEAVMWANAGIARRE